MLVKRWRPPSRATLAVLRELAYFTSVLTVGTVTVLHLLDLSRRTEELYYRASRAQKVEKFKNSLCGPRSDGFSHVDAYIRDRLKAQSWDYEYRDPRAPPPQPPLRRKKPKRKDSSNKHTDMELSLLDSAFDSRFASYPASQTPPSGGSGRPSQPFLSRRETQKYHRASLHSRRTPLSPHCFFQYQALAPGHGFARSASFGGPIERSFSAKAATWTDATVAHAAGFSSSILPLHPTPSSSPKCNASQILSGLTLSHLQLDFLIRLRTALTASEPWSAIRALNCYIEQFQDCDASVWFRPSTLSYILRLSRISKSDSIGSDIGTEIGFNSPLKQLFSSTDLASSYMIFTYLFISNKELNIAIPRHLAFGLLDSLLASTNRGVSVPAEYLLDLLEWLHRHEPISSSYYCQVLQAVLARQTNFYGAREAYEAFIARFLLFVSPEDSQSLITTFVHWAISHSVCDDCYRWLQTQGLCWTDVADVWAAGFASALSDFTSQNEHRKVEIVFFKSKFLSRCTKVSSNSIPSLERLFLLCVHQPPDIVFSRIALHSLTLLAAMNDNWEYLSPFFDLLREKGHESNVFGILCRLEVEDAVPFGLSLFRYFHGLVQSRADSTYFLSTRLVQYAKRTGDLNTVLGVIDEIKAVTTVSKVLLSEIMAALVNVPFSASVLERFLETMAWPLDPDAAHQFKDYFCDMIYSAWRATANIGLVEQIFGSARYFYRHSSVPSQISNLVCRLFLKSNYPEKCFHLLSLSAVEMDDEGMCLVAVAASQAKDWGRYEKVVQSCSDRIRAILGADSYYFNAVLDSYLSSFGLVRGLDLLSAWSQTFGLAPTRRTVYSLACQAFAESRLDLTPEILRLSCGKHNQSLTKLLPPIISALTREWFDRQRPSASAVARVIQEICNIDSSFGTFHLREIWSWAHARFSSSARKLLKLRKGQEPLIPSISITQSELDLLDQQLQPLFRTRAVEEVASPNELAKIETLRSEAVINIFAAIREKNFGRAVDLFCENIELGVHTSPQACRQLSIACQRLGRDGRQMFSLISSRLMSRGIRLPLGSTEMIAVQESDFPLEIEYLVTNFYQKASKKNSTINSGNNLGADAVFPLSSPKTGFAVKDGELEGLTGGIPSTVGCSLAVAGAYRLVALHQPHLAFRLLQEYHKTVKPDRPDIRFLTAFVRSSRLVGDYEGVVWGIQEGLKSEIQLDDQSFLQQVDLATRTNFLPPADSVAASSLSAMAAATNDSVSSLGQSNICSLSASSPSHASSELPDTLSSSSFSSAATTTMTASSAPSSILASSSSSSLNNSENLSSSLSSSSSPFSSSPSASATVTALPTLDFSRLSPEKRAELVRTRMRNHILGLKAEVFEEAVKRKEKADMVGDQIIAVVKLLWEHAVEVGEGVVERDVELRSPEWGPELGLDVDPEFGPEPL